MVEGRDGPRGSQGPGTLLCTFQCTWAHATPRAGPVQENILPGPPLLQLMFQS